MNQHPRAWPLQEAKAKLSELIRLAQTEGPQKITLHGKHVVTVYPSTEKDETEESITGQAFIDAMQACPFKEDFPLVVQGEPMKISDPLDI